MRLGFLGLTVVLCAGVGCGDDGDEDDNGSSAFSGAWKTTTAVQEVSGCLIAEQIGDKANVALTWTVAKSPDASADIVLTSDARPTCALKAKIVENKATLIAGNTCTVSFDAKYDFFYTFNTTSIFELGPDGKTATFKVFASFDQKTKDGQGTGYTCALTETSPLTKG